MEVWSWVPSTHPTLLDSERPSWRSVYSCWSFSLCPRRRLQDLIWPAEFSDLSIQGLKGKSFESLGLKEYFQVASLWESSGTCSESDTITRNHHLGVNSPGASQPGDHLGPAERWGDGVLSQGEVRALGWRLGLSGLGLGLSGQGHGQGGTQVATVTALLRESGSPARGCTCAHVGGGARCSHSRLNSPRRSPWVTPCPWTACSTFPPKPIPRCGL